MAIKPISVDRAVDVVWYDDPAVDKDKSVPAEEYLKKVYDNPTCWRDLLKFKDGQKPSVFKVGVIPPGELATIEDECKLGRESAAIHRMFWLCFLHSVQDISEFPGVEVVEGGRTVRKLPKKSNGLSNVEYVDPTWLATTFAGPNRECAQFIGGVAYKWNQLSEEEIKN